MHRTSITTEPGIFYNINVLNGNYGKTRVIRRTFGIIKFMKPLIIASRGYSQRYPENTLIAFKKAIEAGANGIECDLRFSKDKKIIIHHNAELGTTDSGEGYVYEKDVEYLRSLDCGSWFSPEFKGERMPLLEEIFEEVGNTAKLEIELKDYGKEFIDTLLELLKQHNNTSNIELTSFEYPMLSYIKKRVPSIDIGYITKQIPDYMTQRQAQEMTKSSLIEGIIDIIHFPVKFYDKELVEFIHSLGVQAHGGLCRSSEEIKMAADLGIDRISVYDVELAGNALKE